MVSVLSLAQTVSALEVASASMVGVQHLVSTVIAPAVRSAKMESALTHASVLSVVMARTVHLDVASLIIAMVGVAQRVRSVSEPYVSLILARPRDVHLNKDVLMADASKTVTR